MCRGDGCTEEWESYRLLKYVGRSMAACSLHPLLHTGFPGIDRLPAHIHCPMPRCHGHSLPLPLLPAPFRDGRILCALHRQIAFHALPYGTSRIPGRWSTLFVRSSLRPEGRCHPHPLPPPAVSPASTSPHSPLHAVALRIHGRPLPPVLSGISFCLHLP